MKSIKESAEEYAATGRVSGTEAIRKRAYLAGAKRAAEIGSLTLAEASQYTMALAVLKAETPEQEAQFKANADTLLEASNTIATLFDPE